MSRRLWIVGAVGSVALVAALLAVLATGGNGGDDGERTGADYDGRSVAVASPPGAPAAAGMRITVTGPPRQLIDGWGATVGGDSYLDPQANRAGLSRRQLARLEDALYRGAGINLLRIFGPPLSARDGRWALMRRGRRRGVRFLFTAGDAPARMKRGKRLAAGAEARFARYIARRLSFARRLGVPFSLAAIGNEIDASGSSLQLDAAQAAKVYDRLAREIRLRGLGTRLALADNLNWAGTAHYARAALRFPRVRTLVGIIATHSYGRDDSRGEVRSIARANRLPLWLTEWTAGCAQGDCPDRPDIDFALRWARQITRDLTSPGVNAWFLLRSVDDSTHGPDSGIIVRTRGGGSPFYRTKRFHVLRQFTSAAPPGARRVGVRGALPALAFSRGRRLSLVVTNTGRNDVAATLRMGGRSGRLTARRTGTRENFKRLRSRAYEGRGIRVRLPGRSVTTFTLLL